MPFNNHKTVEQCITTTIYLTTWTNWTPSRSWYKLYKSEFV